MMEPPSSATAPDGTIFDFWTPRAGTRFRNRAKLSCGLGATIRRPDGTVEHTWGDWLNSIFRAKMGMSLSRYLRGKTPPHEYSTT